MTKNQLLNIKRQAKFLLLFVFQMRTGQVIKQTEAISNNDEGHNKKVGKVYESIAFFDHLNF